MVENAGTVVEDSERLQIKSYLKHSERLKFDILSIIFSIH